MQTLGIVSQVICHMDSIVIRAYYELQLSYWPLPSEMPEPHNSSLTDQYVKAHPKQR